MIENLADIAGSADLIFIKNIDNVQPDRLKGDTMLYKRALAGLLVETQTKVNKALEALLAASDSDAAAADAACTFVRDVLRVEGGNAGRSVAERRAFALSKLNRPLRVCG